VSTAAARKTQPEIWIKLPSEKSKTKQETADPVLSDDLTHERQIEVIPQAGELEDRQEHTQEQNDTQQSVIALEQKRGLHCMNQPWFTSTA